MSCLKRLNLQFTWGRLAVRWLGLNHSTPHTYCHACGVESRDMQLELCFAHLLPPALLVLSSSSPSLISSLLASTPFLLRNIAPAPRRAHIHFHDFHARFFHALLRRRRIPFLSTHSLPPIQYRWPNEMGKLDLVASSLIICYSDGSKLSQSS